jgi:DNA (cytosine-5)-methyltransferase 1
MTSVPASSVISFFTGAGFLDLGFEDAGFEVIHANEFDPEFARGYSHALHAMGRTTPRHGVHVGSVEGFLSGPLAARLRAMVRAERRLGRSVGFIGGPPCPDFSVGGKNRGAEGDNGRLTRVYFDLITGFKPDWFLFENVRGLFRTHRHRDFFERMRGQVRAAGYVTSERLINAIEYGAAQDRDRIIMVGALCSRFGAVEELPIRWVSHTVFPRSVLSELPWPEPSEFGARSSRPREVPAELTVQHWFERNAVSTHPNSHHRFAPRAGLPRFQTICEGDDSRKSYKRLHRFRYSPTACYGNNEVHLHPTEPRRISVAEALALQSLPRAFELPADMTLSDMFKTVGNGVPYLAARGLARTVAELLADAGRGA